MKGFEKFMLNPYWKDYYDNAPGENLKRHIFNSFEYSMSLLEPEYEPDTQECRELDAGEIRYLYEKAVGGPEKAYYKKRLKELASNTGTR